MNNTPWLPSLLVAAMVGIIPLLLWWLRRHDSVATQMRDTIALVDDMRRDLADLEEWGFKVRAKWHQQQITLRQAGAIDTVEDLPPMPELRISKHRDPTPSYDPFAPPR